MKTLLAATAFILSLTAANAADAAPSTVLAGGPIYSANALNAICWFANLGTANVTPTSQAMYTWDSNVAISTVNSCPSGNPVSPGTTCYILPSNPPVRGPSCKFVFSTAVTNLRGSLELTDSSVNEISQVELR
ncbi:MAG TPA: hypothetical protein VHT03_12545 [Rhizomicrobium sp.]|jgi:hypothetical protein|nr:hypothetical protein [Rhizomicrobium sp.]